MRYLNVHDKKLPIPSFFQVYNYGGGNGDKDREIVYAEFTEDTPALINYYYINNRYPHMFQSHAFDDLSGCSRIGDLYNDIRDRLINTKGEIYSGYTSQPFDFNTKVFLLDSGAANIVKYIAEEIDYDISRFPKIIVQHMHDYYDFADRLKVDIVVGFDLGGKYTEKAGEKKNKKLMDFLNSIDNEKINKLLLTETIKYLSLKKDYYPHVMATVHGALQSDYTSCVNYILKLEQEYQYNFWGFALGGIASYKQVDDSWYGDINFKNTGKRGFIETVTHARACKIVRSMVGNRPIHALGCGGYSNIAMNYYCGATSFDAASPVRRVGDGNLESTKHVYNPNPIPKVSFSKYFVGGINEDGTLREEPCSYVKLNEVKDTMPLCGCKACKSAVSVINIKDLYHMKAVDNEACYYSRQLMGLHAVRQHRKLCEIIAEYDCIEDFCDAYPSKLNQGLKIIYKQL